MYNENGPRTNNHVEGWHNKINCLAGKSHPNIYEIVELFKTEQAATEVSLLQLEAGGVVAPSRCSGKKRKTKDNSREVFERVLFR